MTVVNVDVAIRLANMVWPVVVATETRVTACVMCRVGVVM